MITSDVQMTSTVTHTPNSLAHQLETLRRSRFSGRLDIQVPKNLSWNVFFYLGRIFFATGGIHPIRRWHRMFLLHCPSVDQELLNGTVTSRFAPPHAQYEQLCGLVRQGVLTREQVVPLVQHMVDEVFFEILQSDDHRYRLELEDPCSPDLGMTSLINASEILDRGMKALQTWRSAGMGDSSPDQAPFLKWPELLRKKTSAGVFQSLKGLLDGKRSLRDLAVQMRLDTLTMARTLLPFIKEEVIVLGEIPDAPLVAPLPTPANGPLIACIDDSLQICQTMEKIMASAGYRYFSIQDPIRGFATLLQRKPDLILLDLVMPNTNGYEICTKLRKTEVFRHTPIIILTGNDGIIDRVRSKLVRSSGFIGKPARAELVLKVVKAHLSKVNRLQGR